MQIPEGFEKGFNTLHSTKIREKEKKEMQQIRKKKKKQTRDV